jgi:hypothetical protein
MDKKDVEIVNLKSETLRLRSVIEAFKRNSSKASDMMIVPVCISKIATGDSGDMWNVGGALLRHIVDMSGMIRMYIDYRKMPFEDFCKNYEDTINPDSDTSIEDQIASGLVKMVPKRLDHHYEFFALQEEVCRIARKSILSMSRNGKIEYTFNITDADIASLKKKLDRYEELRKDTFTVERVSELLGGEGKEKPHA